MRIHYLELARLVSQLLEISRTESISQNKTMNSKVITLCVHTAIWYRESVPRNDCRGANLDVGMDLQIRSIELEFIPMDRTDITVDQAQNKSRKIQNVRHENRTARIDQSHSKIIYCNRFSMREVDMIVLSATSLC